MYKKYRVRLSAEQRQHLLGLTRCGQTTAQQVRRAQTLLLADSGLSDRTIGELVHVHPRTIERTRQRAVEEGVASALVDRPRPGAAPLLDADGELALTVLACSTPPDGRERWTLQLLADAMVELEVVPAISDETVRRTLKKTTSSRGRPSSGAYPS